MVFQHSTSSDPHKEPELDPRYFEQEIDLEMFSETVKYTRKLAEVSPLKDMIGASLCFWRRRRGLTSRLAFAVNETNPGPEVKDDAQIRDWIKKCLSTTWRECLDYHCARSLSLICP